MQTYSFDRPVFKPVTVTEIAKEWFWSHIGEMGLNFILGAGIMATALYIWC